MKQERSRRGSGSSRSVVEMVAAATVSLGPALKTFDLDRVRERTLRRLGYRRGKATGAAILSGLDEALRTATEAVQPRGAYRVLPVLDAGCDSVETEAGPIHSARFARLVRMCAGQKMIVFMLATVGPGLENAYDATESLFQKLVYDALGSEFAEAAADRLEQECREWASKSRLEMSSRFSPGYCDWWLDGQRTIFNALDGAKVGVSLSPYCVMEPVKSVSSIAVAAERVPYRDPCVFCSKKDCRWRRVPQETAAGADA